MFAASKTASVSGGYQISRSLRFNSADSAYLSRTPASASNRQTWTWSGWVKRGKLGIDTYVFGCLIDGTQASIIRFTSGDILRLYTYDAASSTSQYFDTNAVFRDPSAWYHIVGIHDTTQATASNRLKLYINGVQQTGTTTGSVPQNSNCVVNTANQHRIGSNNVIAGQEFDGYMTEVNFIDGQALTPSSFGETNAQTGVWQPKAYSGSYGTNGFYLNFSDNSNTTAATLGKDYSGNGNNWTPNNFSVTAGAGNDSLVDSPTSYGTDTGVGGTVRGNYAILNPLTILPTGQALSITNGNLDYSGTSGWWGARSSIGMTSGKWYCEVTITGGSTPYNTIVGLTTSQAAASGTDFYAGLDAYGWGYFGSNGRKFNNGTSTAYGNNFGLNVTVGIAFDADAGSLTFYESGTSQGIAFTGLTNGPYFFTFSQVGASGSINFGQRPFAYTAPSGYKALCTQNLPTPTIGATSTTLATNYFNYALYTGNGASRSITGLGFQPDFTWIKARSVAYSHRLADSVRGAGKELYSDDTAAETTNSANGYVTSFDSDGFSLGTGIGVNANTQTFIAWNWKANGSGSSNTAGSITSTVSANTTNGFSVVTYTGNGSNSTVGHGLGVVPSFIILKQRNQIDNWLVYHTSIGASNFLRLNTTGASTSGTPWQSTTPTSSVVYLGSGSTSQSGWTYVMYCFAPIAGFSAFGSYTGNSSTDGPFIYLGFTPKYVIIKQTNGAGTDWRVITINTSYLSANTSATEYDSPPGPIRGVSNGIKIVGTGNDINGNTNTYIYAAFAANPFKYALAQPQ